MRGLLLKISVYYTFVFHYHLMYTGDLRTNITTLQTLPIKSQVYRIKVKNEYSEHQTDPLLCIFLMILVIALGI